MKSVAYVYALLGTAALVILGIGGFFLYRWLTSGDGPLANVGNALKASPLGIPARGIDAGISAATGREETLGGWLAEMFDPNTRKVGEVLKMNPVKPTSSTSVYSINPRDRN